MEPAAGTERLIDPDQPSVRGLGAQEDSGLLTVNPLGSLLRGCVVRVDGDGEFSGSGFLVAPGEVLTCAHVVHGRDALTVTWGGASYPAEVSTALPELAKDDPAARFYPLPDVALLRLIDPPGEHPCVRFDLAEPALGPPADVLHLAAHTIGEHQGGTLVASGATLEYEGPLVEQGFRLLKLKGGQIVGGYSGGPFLNTRTGGVCALVDSSRGERDDLGGFGVPLSGFLNQIDGLAERNAASHRVDPRWERAVEDERRLIAERAGERDRLPLDPPLADELVWVPGDPPSDLLRPRYAVVPFIGRENLLAQLMLWRETDVPLAVAVLAGAGGAGKTRTASEVCVQAQRAGWTVGRLADTPGGVNQEGLQALAAWPGRLLITVDYAETRPDVVAELLRQLRRRRAGPPARVVLVVRQGMDRRQLEDLFTTGEAREEFTGLLRRAELARLDADEYALDRGLLFRQAAAAFGAHVSPEKGQGLGPDAARPNGWNDVLPALRAERFNRPLLVLAAALLVAEDPRIDVTRLDAGELMEEVLDRHEAGHWERWNRELGAGLAREDQRRAVALAALLGADTEAEAVRVVRLVPGLEDSSGERARVVARWLSRLYGAGRLDRRPAIAPLEPDLLAEALITREVTALPELLGAALDAASDAQLTRALVVLSRAAGRERFGEVARAALDGRLPAIVRRLAAGRGRDEELLTATRFAVRTLRPQLGAVHALDELPHEETPLATLAAEVTQLAVDILRSAAKDDPDRFLPDLLALSLNTLSVRLSHLGRAHEALAPIEESVEINRALADASPQRYLPDLAWSLNNLSGRLSDLGRTREALAPIEEAVEIRRTLADASPQRYLPDLAMSLNNNLSVWLSALGRPRETLAPIQEAVELFRALADANPERFLPNLAGSLNNLAGQLSDLGHAEEALAPIEEAITIYRELADASQERYLPNLASSLNNLSVQLTALGRAQEALTPLQDVLTQHASNDWAVGVLLLTRATHFRRMGDLPSAIDDTWEAVGLLPVEADPMRNAEARRRLRSWRGEDTAAFDAAWTKAVTTHHPVWLRHLDVDDLADHVLDWVNTPTLVDAQAFLTRHAPTLLTDRGEAALEHLIDANPGNSTLVQHRHLLQDARIHGIQAAYSALLTSLHQQAILDLVDTWIGTPTWTQSRAFLDEHATDLLTDDIEHLLHALVDKYPDDATYLTYFALISLSRREGADAAYALIADPKLLRERAIGQDDTDEPDVALAVARLRAGLQPDNADAHFGHALAAVFGGEPQEGQRAILRCAETSASWERAGYAKRLTESTAGNSGLADQVELLRRVLLDAGSTQAD